MNRNEFALLQAMPFGQKMSVQQIERLAVRVNKGTNNEALINIDLKLITDLKISGGLEETWDDAEHCYVYRKRTDGEILREILEVLNGKY
jgi:hypothetical protein